MDNLIINSFEVTEEEIDGNLFYVYTVRYTYNDKQYQVNFNAEKKLYLDYFKEQIKEHHNQL